MDWIQSIRSKVEAGEHYTVHFGPTTYRVEPRPQRKNPHGRLFIFRTRIENGYEMTTLIARETSAGAVAATIANDRNSQ